MVKITCAMTSVNSVAVLEQNKADLFVDLKKADEDINPHKILQLVEKLRFIVATLTTASINHELNKTEKAATDPNIHYEWLNIVFKT